VDREVKNMSEPVSTENVEVVEETEVESETTEADVE
jgi:hypothetical protein